MWFAIISILWKEKLKLRKINKLYNLHKIKELKMSRTGTQVQGLQSPTSMLFPPHNLSSDHLAVRRRKLGNPLPPPINARLIPKGFKMQSHRLCINEEHWDVGRFPGKKYTHIYTQAHKSLKI